MVILIIWRVLSIPVRFLTNPQYRSLLVLKYLNGKEAHQISNYTEYDRYPELFSKCKELMNEKKDLKILSYGCSTGEEVFTLREYFPDAHILGVDINKHNIRTASRRNKEHKIHFSHHIKQSLEKYAPFDMIFALAVLQRTENRHEETVESTNIYPFEKFNAKVSELDSYLKPNGLFIIDHSDYRFEDADITVHYQMVNGDHNSIAQRVLYDRNNQKLPDALPYARIFIKSPTV